MKAAPGLSVFTGVLPQRQKKKKRSSLSKCRNPGLGFVSQHRPSLSSSPVHVCVRGAAARYQHRVGHNQPAAPYTFSPLIPGPGLVHSSLDPCEGCWKCWPPLAASAPPPHQHTAPLHNPEPGLLQGTDTCPFISDTPGGTTRPQLHSYLHITGRITKVI